MDLPVAVFSPFGSRLFCNKLQKRIINSKENVGKATNPLRFFSFSFAPPAASLSPRIKEMGEGRGKGKLFSSFLGGRRKRGEGGNCHHSSLNSKRKGGGGGKKELRYVLSSAERRRPDTERSYSGEERVIKKRGYMGKGPFHTLFFLRIIWILMWNMYGKKGWTSRLGCEVHKKFFFFFAAGHLDYSLQDFFSASKFLEGGDVPC